MRVCVDETEEEMEFPPELSLGDIIDRLCTQRITQDRVITHVRVNGQEVVEDENGLFPDMPSGEIHSLEVKTEPPGEMAFQGIAHAKGYLERLGIGVQKTAEFFRLGDLSKAHDHYGLCMEGLNWLIQVLEGVRRVLDVDYEGIVLDGLSVQGHIESLDRTIREMLAAQSKEDWVLLSDLLEYELSPMLARWKDILPAIEEAARGSSGEGREGRRAND